MFHISTSYSRLILSNTSLFCFFVLICPAHAVCIIQCQMWRQRGWGCYTPSYALYTPASIIKQIARLRSVFTLTTVCVFTFFSPLPHTLPQRLTYLPFAFLFCHLNPLPSNVFNLSVFLFSSVFTYPLTVSFSQQ